VNELMFNGEPLVPRISGFTKSKKSGVIQNEANAGTRRQRKKYFDTTHDVNASFYLGSPEILDYMLSFIDTNEGEVFICHLATDRPEIEPSMVQAVSEWEFTEINTIESIVSCELEVFTTKILVFDQFLNAEYAALGGDIHRALVGLGEIIEAIPKI